jgi:hypothetical protein
MQITPLGHRINLANEEAINNYWVKIRAKLTEVEEIATVDWKITYALYKPKPVSEKEFREFLNKWENVCEELNKVKKVCPVPYKEILAGIEKKLKAMPEEYKHYPFTNRRLFFEKRLDFYKSLIYKCINGRI